MSEWLEWSYPKKHLSASRKIFARDLVIEDSCKGQVIYFKYHDGIIKYLIIDDENGKVRAVDGMHVKEIV